MLLYQALYDRSVTEIENSKLKALRDEATTLLELFQQLKNSSLAQENPMAYEITEDIISHEFNQSTEFAVALNTASRLSFKERASLQDTLVKLGQYYRASSELVWAARHKKYQIFQRIRVKSFQISVPHSMKLPSKPMSALPLIKNLVTFPETSQVVLCSDFSDNLVSLTLLIDYVTRHGLPVHSVFRS